MKLAGAAAARYPGRPDPAKAGLLLYGADAMRVALKRQEAVAALIGPEGEAEMRLVRMAAAELRRDGASLTDALRAAGFFPGPRVVLLEDAGDGAAETVGAALADWRPGDAVLVVTAGALAAKSALRRLFEDRPDTVAIGIYDDPPGREEVAALLAEAGLARVPAEATDDLMALARALDPGDFRQMVGKLGLYKRGDPAPVTPADVAACAPATLAAEIDDALNAAAEGATPRIGALVRRLEGQGTDPVAVCIAAARHFRALHQAAADPAGAAAGIARVRPPVFGPRRERMLRQAQAWPVARLEEALGLITDTDLTLRSASRAPGMAVMERTLIRLSMLNRRPGT